MANPFTPTFGITPPLLVGRDGDLDDFADGLRSGPGAPERATLLTGLRGTGKTVMLNAYEHLAGTEGWLVVSETATSGLLHRLTTEHLPRLIREHASRGSSSRITGVSGGGFGVERSVEEQDPPMSPGFRWQLETLADVMDERGAGVLITVDEVHRRGIDDLRQIGTTVQHAFRAERPVAFVGAGLPTSISDLLNDDVLTFLRRADRRNLRAVSEDEVAEALRRPVEESGRSITADALDLAVAGTAGYPFLIQLVGLHSWRESKDASMIDASHVERGVERARRRVGQLVHASALSDLSARDRSFLAAMAVDDGPSRMGDIQARLDVSQVYAGQYRLRLIEAEMIESTGWGIVDFTLPGLREHLREQAPSDAWR